MQQQNILSYLIPALIVGIVLFFRFRSMGKARQLRLERLWIAPVIYLGVAALLFVEMPPHGLAWLWAGLSLVGGGIAGWYRGAAMHISVDPETHALSQRSSPLAILFILALIAIRSAIRAGASYEPGLLDIVLVTDCLVAFALGLLSITRLEMYLRGSRLLRDAKGA